MPDNQPNTDPVPLPETLGPTQHALLFALIAEKVIQQAGEERGGQALEKAVWRYGAQRGRRMALRAQRDGRQPDIFTFLVYSELKVAAGEMDQVVGRRSPDLEVAIPRCPWHVTWEKNGFSEVGKFYCQGIDHALAHGFNHGIEFEVRRIRPLDGAACEFVYHRANLSGLNLLRYWFAKRFKPGASGVMTWEYHLGHLYKTLAEVLVEEMGEVGRQAAQSGINAFAARCGADLALQVLSCQAVDFNEISARSPG